MEEPVLVQSHEEKAEGRRVLITGAAGFVGSYVLEHLYDTYPDYVFVNLDLLTYAGREENVAERIRDDKERYTFIKGDICDGDLVKWILKKHKICTIMHLAAETFVDKSFHNAGQFVRSNVLGTTTLLQAAYDVYHRPGVQKGFPGLRLFFFCGTDEVYGSQLHNSPANPYTEDYSLMAPSNPYAASKCGAELMVQGYIQSFDLPAVLCRMNNVYGKSQFYEKCIPKFITLALLGRPISLHGDGSAKRSFMHASDAARAFDVLVHKGKLGTVYNVGVDEELTVKEVASQILALVHADKPREEQTSYLQHVRDRAFNDKRYFVSSDKLRALGWQPLVKFEDGLRSTYEWYRKHYATLASVEAREVALQPHPTSLLPST